MPIADAFRRSGMNPFRQWFRLQCTADLKAAGEYGHRADQCRFCIIMGDWTQQTLQRGARTSGQKCNLVHETKAGSSRHGLLACAAQHTSTSHYNQTAVGQGRSSQEWPEAVGVDKPR